MNNPLNILVIAPNAPPENSSEAIQVGRILAELDKHATGRLVMANLASRSSWARSDPSLALTLQNFDTQLLELPLHRFTRRVLMSHRLRHLHVPDSLIWITWMTGSVLRSLPRKPDIIYSRSTPMSSAMLARKLKLKLQIPWIMHLSDPWAEDPYKRHSSRDARYEAKCFKVADLISLTTRAQAEHYQQKYPALAHKIFVSPNVMPNEKEAQAWRIPASPQPAGERLYLVFAGTFYGARSPKPLLEALDILGAKHPDIRKRLHIDIYGNAQTEALNMLKNAPDVVHYHGPVSFREVCVAQSAADIVLSIEADLKSIFSTYFLPAKIMDYLALGKPILAITPDGSETAQICREGYGWAIAPSRPEEIAALLTELVGKTLQLRQALPKDPPARYKVKTVTENLLLKMNQLKITP